MSDVISIIVAVWN